MDYTQKAKNLHESGCNCCQAVIMCCSEQFGIPEDKAYALMGLGLMYGDENNRQCGKSKEFMKAFEAEFGSVLCREILAKHQKKICPVLINFAAKYLEDELK